MIGMDAGRAAQVSSLFPLFGGFSVLLVGFLSDRIGRIGRAALILGGLLLSIPALLFLAYVKLGDAQAAMLMLGTVALVMLGPYSFLAGAVALDFGGKRGSASACGWIDGIGYLGGVFAGGGIGKIAQDHGWTSAFLTLTGVAVATTLAAILYLVHQMRLRPA
jgi:OPA family glycerol-3-phosphate transporter-like MFS transporter